MYRILEVSDEIDDDMEERDTPAAVMDGALEDCVGAALLKNPAMEACFFLEVSMV